VDRHSPAAVFRYLVIDMARELEVDAGVPVAEPVEGDGSIVSAVLPAGLSWDMAPADGGERWGGRLEFYLTDPGEDLT
jgi:hypothetical protein